MQLSRIYPKGTRVDSSNCLSSSGMQAAKWLPLISKQWVSHTLFTFPSYKPHLQVPENHPKEEKDCQTGLDKQTKHIFIKKISLQKRHILNIENYL